MSSKEEILARIRRNTQKSYEMPDLGVNAITYEDKINTFIKVLEASGGEAHLLLAGEEVNDVIRSYYPKAERIASNLPTITCATLNPDALNDPRELDGVDVAVVRGSFGVAETAAVWLPKQTKHKAVFFISNALVILLKREDIVNNMNEAYQRIVSADYDYGVFMSGPSKTADIEQALVFGAHGPIRVTVILM